MTKLVFANVEYVSARLQSHNSSVTHLTHEFTHNAAVKRRAICGVNPRGWVNVWAVRPADAVTCKRCFSVDRKHGWGLLEGQTCTK